MLKYCRVSSGINRELPLRLTLRAGIEGPLCYQLATSSRTN
nr:MAG TPA: hypothetical protein [Caudoviricetes sp.]